MAGATLTTAQFSLKNLWPQDRVDNLVYKDHALLAMMPKDTEFYGESAYLALMYSNNQGRSADFATAQTNAGYTSGVRFNLTRIADYQVAQLTTEVIRATKRDKGALLRALDQEMKGAFANIGSALAIDLYGNGSGARGQIDASGVTSGVFTLANPNDVVKFEVRMVIVAAATETGTIRSGSGTITNINRDTGTITYSGTISSVAAGDYLFVQGDAPNTGAMKKVSGLQAWIPSTAPTSTPFFGVDRTADVTRLGGLRIDVSSLNPEEGLVTAFSKQSREGGKPDKLFCNFDFYRSVEIALGSKVEYESMSMGDIGFTGLRVIAPKGNVTVIADQDCPSGKAFSLQMNTWKLRSLEACPGILDEDGLELSRVYNADQWEARIGYWAQLGCQAPGWNANITVPTST